MDSYLAESYGLLSSCCFWFRITKLVLHRQRPKFKIKFYCDNQSLVRRVNEFLNYFYGRFRCGLTANYDVVYLIACALRLFPEDVVEVLHDVACALRLFPEDVVEVLHDVKGHQDSIRPPTTLSWPAQLNVLADRAANNYIRQHPEPQTTSPVLPSSQIHLHDSQHQPVIKQWTRRQVGKL